MTRPDRALVSQAPASERAARPFHDASYRPPLIPPPPDPALPSRAARGAAAERARTGPRVVEAAPALQSLVGRVGEIIALDDRPVLRNLLITQCYHDLSAALATLLGGGNVNWCTFATWASKTAGRFIRKDEVPALLRKLVVSDDGERDVRASGVRLRAPANNNRGSFPRISFDMLPPWSSDGPGLFDMPERVLDEVSLMITQGNLKVFAELGPMFARMIAVYGTGGRPTQEQLDTLLEPLAPGPSGEGGQGLLRSALAKYHEAMLTDDADHRAELILLGNARIGLHEQVRLQPFIAGSLNAPIRCMVDTVSAPAARLPEVLHSAMLEGMLRPAVEKIETVWRKLATKEMMTLRLPNEVLDLGCDLPALAGQPLYPEHLSTIEEPELYELLKQYGAHDDTTAGSGAHDWASLPARMGYILELFRSRQCFTRLLEAPFSAEQHAELLALRVPTFGDL